MRHTVSLAAAYGKNSRRFIVGGNAKANLTQAEAAVCFSLSFFSPLIKLTLFFFFLSIALTESFSTIEWRLYCTNN
jgi:hypothetical protein